MLELHGRREWNDEDLVEIDVENEGRPIRLSFLYDRVPPDRVNARRSDTGETVDVFESGYGTYIVHPTSEPTRLTISYEPGIGMAELDAAASETIEDGERSEPTGRGLGDLFARVKRKLEARLASGHEPDIRAQHMWLRFDLATTAFQDGRIEEDTDRYLKSELGSIPIDFDRHTKKSAVRLQRALMQRMHARRHSEDPATEPPLEFERGEADTIRLATRDAARRAGMLMLASIETVDEFALVEAVDSFVVPVELWYAMLGFASGTFFLPLEGDAKGQFNCAPNGIALTLFAEYARAAHSRSEAADGEGVERPLVGAHRDRRKWKALWPLFVAMIEAFQDSYQWRGGPRVLRELRGTAKRKGETPWSLESCERARNYYEGLSEVDLLAHWRRLLQGLDRDASVRP